MGGIMEGLLEFWFPAMFYGGLAMVCGFAIIQGLNR